MTVTLTLPARPDLAHLKKQAKQLLQEVRAQKPEALQTIRAFHPRPAEFAGLRDAQLTLARRYGFADWEQLSHEVELRHLRSGTLAEQAQRFVDHACLRYNGDDQAWRYRQASEWLRQVPELVRSDFYCALVAADLKAVSEFLQREPALAQRDGGPRNWPALMYLTYSRLEQNPAQVMGVARALLESGASPDSHTAQPPGFTAITGAIGEGERGSLNCVPHPHAQDLVKLLLDAGANPNQSQALYNTMLGENLGKWLLILVEYGLKAGDKCNWSDDDDEPIFDFLLSQVVLQGKVELVRYLLEHGANANAVSRYHHRPAHAIAQLTGRTEIAGLLAQHGARTEPLSMEDRFRIACMNHDFGAAEELLREHAQLLRGGELFGHCAMVDVEVCLWLMRQGYDINSKDHSGQTVLHRYALWNRPEAVATLLQHGADPDATEFNWQATPLGMALHHHHWAVVEVLLPISNSLFDVCRMADTERAKVLLSRDASLVNRRTSLGNTPLHLISQAKQDDPDVDASIATIELLLNNGADPKALNHDGKTPQQWYRQFGMDELADYLADRRGPD